MVHHGMLQVYLALNRFTSADCTRRLGRPNGQWVNQLRHDNPLKLTCGIPLQKEAIPATD